MKTFVSSSFLLFLILRALSSKPSTIMFNLRSSLSLRLSTLSLTTCDKSAITLFFMSVGRLQCHLLKYFSSLSKTARVLHV